MSAKFHSFFHPHDPAKTAYTGELVNPWTGDITTPPSMTKQEFMDECDIHKILSEFKVTGQIRHLAANAAAAVYTDLANLPDYQTALNTVIEGEAAFASLPSTLRNRFDNNPAEFIRFMSDPANQDEAIKLGLATDNRPPPEAPPAPPAEPPPRS